jgi:hypothetical protein
MIIGIGKGQMRSRAALGHIARKKGKGRQKKDERDKRKKKDKKKSKHRHHHHHRYKSRRGLMGLLAEQKMCKQEWLINERGI